MSPVVDEYGGKEWACGFCNKTFKNKYIASRHVETHFEGMQHQCPHCENVAPSRDALRKHISRKHKS